MSRWSLLWFEFMAWVRCRTVGLVGVRVLVAHWDECCCYSLLCVGFGWRGSGAVRSDGMSW